MLRNYFLFISVTVIYQLTNFFCFPAHDFGREAVAAPGGGGQGGQMPPPQIIFCPPPHFAPLSF